jgi:mannose-1-phosphate guanylyltransferase
MGGPAAHSATVDIPRKAMLLAAGEGARLRPLTAQVPKVMVPIAGRPLLEHTVSWLRRYGVTDLLVNVCHLADAIVGYFGDGSRWGVRITYSREERALGTAGGVRRASWFFDGPFLLWYGDNLSRCRLDRLWAAHCAGGGVATLALHWREDVTRSGIVGLSEEDGHDRVVRFVEKPRPDQVFSHWVNAGITILEREVVEAIPPEGAPDFGRDVFPALLAQGARLTAYRLAPDEGLWWIDTREDLRRVEEAVRSGQWAADGVQWAYDGCGACAGARDVRGEAG